MTPDNLSRQVKQSYGVSGSYTGSKPKNVKQYVPKTQQNQQQFKTATLDLSSSINANNNHHLQQSYKHVMSH